MPKIGNYTPNEPLTPFIQNSPGPVGAPGLPDTGANVAAGIIHGQEGITNELGHSQSVGLGALDTVVGGAINVYKNIQKHQAQRKTKEKEQAEAQNVADVSANSVPLMYRLHDLRESVQRDNASDPDSWAQKFRDQLPTEVGNFYTQQKIDPKGPVALKLNELSNSFAISADNELTKTGPTQRTANIDATTTASLNQAVKSATNANSISTSFQAIGLLRPALEKLQGAKAESTINAYKAQVVMNALKGEAVTDPKKTLGLLSSATENFNNLLTNDQMQELHTLANKTQTALEKTASDKAVGIQSAEKAKIDDIKYGYTNNPNSTDMDRAHAQAKLLEYKSNTIDPELRKYAAEAYDHLENKKSEQEKAALDARQTAALEATAKSQKRQEEMLAHKEYLGSKPVMKLRAEAEAAYDTAYNLDKKLDPGTKISLINKATDTLNAMMDKKAISDAEFIARKGALNFKRNQVNESLTPSSGGLAGMVRQNFGSNEEHYYDAISAGASPEIIKFRGHEGSEAEKLNDNSEFISRLARYIEAHKAMQKALPNPNQLKQYVDITNNDMKREGPQ